MPDLNAPFKTQAGEDRPGLPRQAPSNRTRSLGKGQVLLMLGLVETHLLGWSRHCSHWRRIFLVAAAIELFLVSELHEDLSAFVINTFVMEALLAHRVAIRQVRDPC